MGNIGTLILVTTIAGAVGTGLGGVVGALFKKDSSRTVSLLLSFAGGVMLSIVCFDLVLGAIETETNINIIILTILLGVAVVYLLNYLIDKRTNPEVPHIDSNHPQTADALDELIHSDHLNEHIKKKDDTISLFIAGVVMACAIALHNIPEGMTIGASYANTNGTLVSSALVLSVLIGLHNIPEGMAVAVPLISGGMPKLKAILITTLSGVPTIIGGILGYFIGDIGPLGLAISLCFASGAMLYVVFGEILPQAILLYRSKLPAFSTIIGMAVGLLVIYA
ncbi:MAG: ZIP family metal transporter [Intestinibacter sp.]